MPETPLQKLLTAHISGSLDDAAREDLANLLDTPGAREQFAEVFDTEMLDGVYDIDGEQELSYQRLMKALREKIRKVPVAPTHRTHFLYREWVRYAAAVVLIVGAVTAVIVYFNQQPANSRTELAHKNTASNITPGTNKAVLTVDNKQIDLSSGKTGITVSKSNISYTDGKRLSNAGNVMMLTTPKGGQYQAVLPDGSKVWLNAASSIKFPAAFNGTKRNVEITGEVYMEITQNVKQPFIVNTGGTEIQILGTSFNINAYEDEAAIKTTLISGRVKINQKVILKPGQQAAVKENDIQVQVADIEQVLAWKNGLFSFHNSDLRSVMRQLERWYNIKVRYEGTASNITLNGKMYRNVNLSDVLEFLTDMGLRYRMEDKTLIVL